MEKLYNLGKIEIKELTVLCHWYKGIATWFISSLGFKKIKMNSENEPVNSYCFNYISEYSRGER